MRALQLLGCADNVDIDDWVRPLLLGQGWRRYGKQKEETTEKIPHIKPAMTPSRLRVCILDSFVSEGKHTYFKTKVFAVAESPS
jgi:hypothetical protein